MAGSINKVILVGNLGRDPEVRMTQDGKEIANLTIATSDSWRDKSTGERKERTEWHRVVIFNDALVNVTKNYLHKGSKVYIEGSLQTRKWVDQGGVERYSTEVVLQGFNSNLTMLDNRREQQSEGGYQQSGGGQQSSQGSYAPRQQQGHASAGAPQGRSVSEELDDDIPF